MYIGVRVGGLRRCVVKVHNQTESKKKTKKQIEACIVYTYTGSSPSGLWQSNTAENYDKMYKQRFVNIFYHPKEGTLFFTF